MTGVAVAIGGLLTVLVVRWLVWGARYYRRYRDQRDDAIIDALIDERRRKRDARVEAAGQTADESLQAAATERRRAVEAKQRETHRLMAGPAPRRPHATTAADVRLLLADAADVDDYKTIQ